MNMNDEQNKIRQRGFERINSEKDNKEILIPKRSTKHSAAYDIHSSENIILPAQGKCKIHTKIKAYMQEDEVLIIHPRSSQGIKQNVRLQNTTGIVDSDYYNNPANEGEIIIFLENRSQEDIAISKGDRISQAMFQKFLLTDDDDVVNERVGGFGSTGK